MKVEQDRIYNDVEAILFIYDQLGIPTKIIAPVLDSKWDYYEKIGLLHDEPVEDEEPMIIDEEDIIHYVEKDLGIPKEIIELIIHSEDDYLVAKGILGAEMS